MSYRTNLVYRYDGTFPGFLCCVFQCFSRKELPCGIESWDEPQETLFPRREIDTDLEQAGRVERSIPKKISPEAYHMVRVTFLSCLPEKEMHLLRFLLLGFREGGKVTGLVANEDVDALRKAVIHTEHEAHLFLGFARFSDFGGFLAAQISPKNNVLPLMADHFCDRFSGEDFLLWDKVHCLGFVHSKKGEARFFQADKIDLPEPDETEEEYRALWRHFYETIAIEGRTNPRCRMSHMPKRFWDDLTEMQA